MFIALIDLLSFGSFVASIFLQHLFFCKKSGNALNSDVTR